METSFSLIAGHIALELLNTLQKNLQGDWVELLSTPELATRWSAAIGNPLLIDLALLEELKEFREDLRELVSAWSHGHPAPFAPLSRLNALLATSAAFPVVGADFSGRMQPATTPAHPLLPLAQAAVELFTSQDRLLVRRCEGAGCVLWFLDSTKNKKRRWCRMEACGNRMKQLAYQRRRKAE